jgi:hypothetical protein
LPGLAIVLGLILTAELTAAPDRGAGPLSPPSSPMGEPAGTVSDAVVDHWADTVLSRPLFSADRRPERMVGDHTAGLARLAGIIISGGSRSAIFAAKGQKPEIMTEGGEIGGYRLLHISFDSVELAGAAGTLTVHLRFPLTAPSAAPAKTARALPPPQKSLFSYDNE